MHEDVRIRNEVVIRARVAPRRLRGRAETADFPRCPHALRCRGAWHSVGKPTNPNRNTTEGRVRTAISALLMVAGALGAAACGESGTGVGQVQAGEFRATVSGHASGDFTGTAYLYDGDNEFIPGRYVVLTSTGGEAEITIRGGGILSSGTDFDFQVGRHPLGLLSDVQADLSINPPSTVGPLYIATDGALRVTSSTADRVAGEFDFDAVVHLQDGSTRAVKVSGAFHAVPGNTFNAAQQLPASD